MVKTAQSYKIYSIAINEDFMETWEKFRIYANRDGRKMFSNLKSEKAALEGDAKKEYKLPKVKDNNYISLVIRHLFKTYVQRQDQLKLKEIKNEPINNTN